MLNCNSRTAVRTLPLRGLLISGLLLLGACQGLPGENRADRNQRQIAAELLRMDVRLGAETTHLSNFTVNGFRAINEQSLVVTAGVHDHYLVTLVTPCLELPWAFTVAFRSRTSNITNFDDLIVNSLHGRPEQCRIDKIFQLEDLAADAAEPDVAE